MVYVLPVPVCPYTNNEALLPFKTSSNAGLQVSEKTSS